MLYKITLSCINLAASISKVILGDHVGWTSFNIGDILLRISDKNVSQGRLLFTIDCTNCRQGNTINDIIKEGYDPYISVTFIQRKPNIRNRRSHKICFEGQKTCCKRDLRVHFKELDWSDWVLAPETIEVNYCHGSCERSSRENTYWRFIEKSKDVSNSGLMYESCCVPLRHACASILYIGEDGILYKKEVKDMSVDECGCT